MTQTNEISKNPETASNSSAIIPNQEYNDSNISLITKRELHYPSRVIEVIESQGAGLAVNITDACKSNDSHTHQLQNYIVYLIQLGPISVKRRYSEFEALRFCLIKQFPTAVIPPIPEKQSLRSSIALTTSNPFGLSNTPLSITNGGNHDMSSGTPDQSSKTPGDADPMVNLVEYRKRMLAAFLNRCLKIEEFTKCRFLLNFFDPEVNFLDYINNKENHTFYKTSIFQLSPVQPLNNLENQLYLTLPIPSSSDAHLFKELSEEEQFQKFINFEMKFMKYELVLNNISKITKHVVKNVSELSVELSDLGSTFNQLSLIQDSNSIELIGKFFDRHTILLSTLNNSINVGFLDKLIELKHFSKTCKELMEYNRKKIIQFKLLEKELYSTRSRYKRYETEEIRIRKIDMKTENALNRSNVQNSFSDTEDYIEPPITDEELQTALYSKSFNKTVYGKIPGVSKFNNIILKYVSDPDPEETRRTKFYNLKLRLFQLERQFELTQCDLQYINNDVMIHLHEFHQWFKTELRDITAACNTFLTDYFGKSRESWMEMR